MDRDKEGHKASEKEEERHMKEERDELDCLVHAESAKAEIEVGKNASANNGGGPHFRSLDEVSGPLLDQGSDESAGEAGPETQEPEYVTGQGGGSRGECLQRRDVYG